MKFGYKIEGDEYVLYRNNEIVLKSTNGVALSYAIWGKNNNIFGVVHKHGAKENVMNWHNKAVKTYNDSGFFEEADSLHFISGRIPIEELNKCLQITDYIVILHKKIKSGKLDCQNNFRPDIDKL